jgi:hypothetical protein
MHQLENDVARENLTVAYSFHNVRVLFCLETQLFNEVAFLTLEEFNNLDLF